MSSHVPSSLSFYYFQELRCLQYRWVIANSKGCQQSIIQLNGLLTSIKGRISRLIEEYDFIAGDHDCQLNTEANVCLCIHARHEQERLHFLLDEFYNKEATLGTYKQFLQELIAINRRDGWTYVDRVSLKYFQILGEFQGMRGGSELRKLVDSTIQSMTRLMTSLDIAANKIHCDTDEVNVSIQEYAAEEYKRLDRLLYTFNTGQQLRSYDSLRYVK